MADGRLPKAFFLVLVVLALAQALYFWPLHSQTQLAEASPDSFDDLAQWEATAANIFHLCGSVLGLLGLWLVGRKKTAAGKRALLLALIPIGISSLVWLSWAPHDWIYGVRSSQLVLYAFLIGGLAGCLDGTLLPPISLVLAWRRARADAPGATTAYALVILFWSWAFLVTEFIIGVSA